MKPSKICVSAAFAIFASSVALAQVVIPLDCPPGDPRFNARVFFRLISLKQSFCGPGAIELQYGVEWTDPSPGVPGTYTVCGVDIGCPQGHCPWCFGGIEGTRFEYGSTIPVCPPVIETINDRLKFFTDITVIKSDGTRTLDSCTPVEFPSEYCSDGHKSAGEECDDGNTSSQDCCSTTCQAPERGAIGNIISWDLVQTEECGISLLGDKVAVQDGALNTVTNKCVRDDFFNAQFLATFTSQSGASVEVGKCVWFGGRNEGWAVFSPTPGTRCITEVYWRSREPGIDQGDHPGEIDWVFWYYDAITKKRVIGNCHSVTGPGGNDDNCSLEHSEFPLHDGEFYYAVDKQQVESGDDLTTMGPEKIAFCDNDRDGDCDAADLSLAFAAIGGCQSTGDYNQSVDLDSDGCVSQGDFERYRTSFPDCVDGQDNDGDDSSDFPEDAGCLNAADPLEQALPPNAPIRAVWIPVNSTETNTHPAVSGIWKSVAPPFPLDTNSGIGNLIREEVSLNRFVLHDHAYVAPHVPDPRRAQVTYEFDHSVAVNQLEVIQHANGITKVEAFVGDTFADLTSIGSFLGSRGDATGPGVFAEGESYVFDFGNQVAGRLFHFIIRKTSLDSGYAAYRAFLRDGTGNRIQAAKLTECNDGIDNDSDGLVDFPDDLDCQDKRDQVEVLWGTVSNLTSLSHAIDVYSSDRTIEVSWIAPTDNPRAVVGYSVQFDSNISAACDQVQETAGTSAGSASLADGDWYVHVCAVDDAGNWGAAASTGPFRIDGTDPTAVTSMESSSHRVNIFSNDHTIDVSWVAAVDTPSGVAGYAYQFDTNASWTCDQAQDTVGTSVSSAFLADGTWFIHVCAVDVAGNWGPVADLGPFPIADTGTLIIAQNTVPDGPQDFSYSSMSFVLDDDTDPTVSNTFTMTLDPGSYDVTQDAVSGFVLTGLTCSDPSGGTSTNISTRTATVGLALGETVSCIFTNTQHSTIRIVQDTVPNRAEDFAFAGDLGGFSLDDDDNGTLSNSATFAIQPGTYSVSQTASEGFSLVLSCADPSGGTATNAEAGMAIISLAAGETVACTFQNTLLEGFYFTVTPCRVMDTRQPADGPALSHKVVRTVTLHGLCGIPTTASALMVNVTVTGSTGAGYLSFYPSYQSNPGTSTINFAIGQTRANNAILLLAMDGSGTVDVSPTVAGGGIVHLIVDVVGYFP